MGIEKIDLDRCTGCGTCDHACPMDVIHFDKKEEIPKIVHKIDCQCCFLCVMKCRENAIIVSASRERPMPMPYKYV